MLDFICGTKGSGKSTVIKNRIIMDLSKSEKVLLLVPEQMTVEAERGITASASEFPTSELEVTNFKRLANSVFRKYGGISYKYIDKGARVLVMWQALCAVFSELDEYGKAGSELDLAKEMLSVYDDFKAYGIGESELLSLCAENSGASERLKRKLCDISYIFRAYEKRLFELDYSDTADELTRLSSTLETHDFFKGMNVYIDSFYGFTKQEYGVIEYILRDAKNVTVSLCFDPEHERYLFRSGKLTKKRICDIAKKYGISIGEGCALSENPGLGNYAMRALEKKLRTREDFDKYEYDGKIGKEVRIIRCRDKYEEAEMLACEISKKIRSGSRYKDFAVIARSAGDYVGIADVVLRRNGIPCFISEKDDLKVKPLIKFILAAVETVNGNFRTDDVISYIKTGYTGISPEECDKFEEYLRLWGIRGLRFYDNSEWNMNPDGYTKKVSARGEEVLRSVNATREKIAPPLTALCERLCGKHKVREICEALYIFLTDAGADEMSAEDEEASAAWNCLMGAFDSMVNVLGETELECRTFSELLLSLVSELSIGRIPQTCDEVIIGSADSLRAAGVKHAFLIGVSEGIFPKNADERGILTDSEKKELEALGCSVSKTCDDQNDDEALFLYNAACCAEKSVTFSYTAFGTDGGSLEPSRVLSDIKTVFNIEETVYADVDTADKIWNYDASFDKVMQEKGSVCGFALSSLYSKDPVYSGRMDELSKPIDASSERVSPDVAEKIFGDEMVMSPSKLEKFVLCRFEYYCRYVLKLDDGEKISFKPTDVGTFIHHVMETFLKKIKESGEDDAFSKEYDDEYIDGVTREITESYYNDVCGSEKIKSGKLNSEFENLRRASALLIKNTLREFRTSKFRPSCFELKIDFDENCVHPLKIQLRNGKTLSIHGIADRIDTYQKDNDVYVRVVDYKTGGKDFSLSDVKRGLSLQMLMYLYSVCLDKDKKLLDIIGEEKDGEILPAGVIYCRAKGKKASLKSSSDLRDAENKAAEGLERKGIVLDDEEIVNAMDTAKGRESEYLPRSGSRTKERYYRSAEEFKGLLEEIKLTLSDISTKMYEGDAGAVPIRDNDHNDCRYCTMKPVCRMKNYT